MDATASLATVAQAADVPVTGGCADATLADIAWDGTSLYVACVDSTHALTVKRARRSLIRVYAKVTDARPAFDAVLPGSFDLASTAHGLVLAVCDLAGDRKLRTFVSW